MSKVASICRWAEVQGLWLSALALFVEREAGLANSYVHLLSEEIEHLKSTHLKETTTKEKTLLEVNKLMER